MFRPLSLAVVLIAALILISKLTPVSKAVWIIVMVIALVLALVSWVEGRTIVRP